MMTKLAELVEYYEARYAAPPGAMRDYSEYLRLLEVRPGAWLADVGCGEGQLLAEADRAGLSPVGVEISVGALRLCQQNAPGVPLVLATGEALPFGDAGFDLVTCLGSLEHFPSPGLGLREIARILRASGSGLVAVPNRRFIGWRLLRRRGTEQQAVAETLFDRDEWYELMGAAGLEVVRVAKEPWHTKPYRSWGRRLLLRWAWRLIPLRWTYQFAFICRRAVGSASGVQEGQGGAGGAGGA